VGGSGSGFSVNVTQTPVQHNYPTNPLPAACRIASFFDAVRNQRAHHAQDVVLDNGQGGSQRPAYGTAVTAMESGTVRTAISGNGPASTPYPGCAGLGVPGNYVKIIADGDTYSTIYFHMTASVSAGQHVNAGDVIGHLDNSGCQSGAHLHVGRKDPSGNPVNFTIPCVNQVPTTKYDDGTVGDDVPDNL
ncbi:MAG: M23 family metallopeptidase, partial [Acidobacteriota bacterium]|nr:M23 family metallopeptidase [Acidobacteriota bacterium]